MENFTSQREKLTPKQLQNNIREAICAIPSIGIDASAERFNLKSDTLKRVLGIKITKVVDGKLTVLDWARNNNLTKHLAMKYLKSNGHKMWYEDGKYGIALMCNDVEYTLPESNYYSIREMASKLGMKRQNLDYYVKQRNIPVLIINGVRCFEKSININEYLKEKEEDSIDFDLYETISDLCKRHGKPKQNVVYYLNKYDIPFKLSGGLKYYRKDIDIQKYIDAPYGVRV